MPQAEPLAAPSGLKYPRKKGLPRFPARRRRQVRPTRSRPHGKALPRVIDPARGGD